MQPETLYYTTHRSALGALLLVASPRGMRHVMLLEEGTTAEDYFAQKFPGVEFTMLEGFFASSMEAIDRYLNDGEPLKLPVDLVGGMPLQRMVWLEIAKVPYGETISYTMLAERVGFPRAVRAVASACGANPLPLVIPCHRIMAKDGSMGGFSMAGGIATKEAILRRESRGNRAAA